MIEIDINKIVSWEEINKIKELSKKDFVIIRIPNSVYENEKMKYKIKILEEEPTIYMDIKTYKRGRKIKVNNNINQQIIKLVEKGYTIREVGEELGISKSTVWNYAKDLIKDIEVNKFKTLLWEYKQQLIENELYDSYVESLFLELEHAVEVGDLNRAYELLSELRYYIEHDE
jgi:hypothetical protein